MPASALVFAGFFLPWRVQAVERCNEWSMQERIAWMTSDTVEPARVWHAMCKVALAAQPAAVAACPENTAPDEPGDFPFGEPGEPPSIQDLRNALAQQDTSITGMLEAESGSERMQAAQKAWTSACSPHAIQWLLQNTTNTKDIHPSEILLSLGWTCIGGQWNEDRAATATFAQRRTEGQMVAFPEAPGRRKSVNR